MNLTMSLHYGYLSSDSFLWREVKTASVGKVSLNLLVELSELSISSIHVPFLCLHTDEYLHRIKNKIVIVLYCIIKQEKSIQCYPPIKDTPENKIKRLKCQLQYFVRVQ